MNDMNVIKQYKNYRLIKVDYLIKTIDEKGYCLKLKTIFKIQIKINILFFNIWITFKEIVDETGTNENIKFNRLNSIELFNTIINV